VEEGDHEGAELPWAAGDPHAVGADEPEFPFGGFPDLPDGLPSLLAGLAEAAGDYHGSLDALRDHVLEYTGDEACWNHYEGGVNIVGNVPNVGIAFESEDLLSLGIDGIDISFETALLDRCEEHVTPLKGVGGCSDDCDALRHQYLVKGFLCLHN
jgi:hypothetical protein